MKKTVLIAIDEFAKASDYPVRMLKEYGFHLVWNDSGRPLHHTESSSLYERVDYVIAGLEEYPSAFFEKFPKVSAISRIGVGTDAINIKAATDHNVKIFITSDKPAVAVAELCISNMIALLRSTYQMCNELKQSIWNPIQGRDLRSCTVGIIGMGSIGKEVIKRLAPFGSKVIACSRTWDKRFARDNDVERRSIEDVFRYSDVITVHLPLTPETKGIVSKELISKITEGAVLLNTSRAGVIDNVALAEALKANRLAGVAIDVFDEERDPHPYGNLDRVILTPHIGSHTMETRKDMEEMAVKNLMVFDSLTEAHDPTEIGNILSYIDNHSVN